MGDGPADAQIVIAPNRPDLVSGWLSLGEQLARSTLEPGLPRPIVLLEDPQEQASGPIWIRGGVSLVSAGGNRSAQRNPVTPAESDSSRS